MRPSHGMHWEAVYNVACKPTSLLCCSPLQGDNCPADTTHPPTHLAMVISTQDDQHVVH